MQFKNIFIKAAEVITEPRLSPKGETEHSFQPVLSGVVFFCAAVAFSSAVWGEAREFAAYVAVAFLILYALTLTRWVELARWMTAFCLLAPPWALVIFPDELPSQITGFHWMAASHILIALIFSLRTFLVVTCLNILAVFVSTSLLIRGMSIHKVYETLLFLSVSNLGVMGIFWLNEYNSHRIQLQNKDLAAARDYSEAVISSMSEALFVVDAHNIIQKVNEALLSLTGYEERAILGQNANQFLSAGQAEPAGKLVEGDCLFLAKNGEQIPTQFGFSPIYQGTNYRGLVCLLYDLRPQKQMKEALVSAKEAAEKANEAKSRFLANMSHEIRTPLSAILGFSHLLQDMANNEQFSKNLPENFISFLTHIERAGQNLSEVINNVLDLSKIEAGKLEKKIEPINIKVLCQGLFELHKNIAAPKGVELFYLPTEGFPEMIQCDRSILNQILNNLLSNAIKFTPKGKSVHFTVIKQDDQLKIEVMDQGVGIAKDHLVNIFDAFEQADTSRTRKFGGTGLGLSIARQLAEEINGTLDVESEEGEGSRFWLTLPYIKTDRKERKSLKTKSNYLVSPGTRSLIVEDNEQNRVLLGAFLKDWGFEVIEAENGLEGVEKAKSENPDIILMDLHMPFLNGFDAAKRIRAEPWGSKIPLLALSADAFKERHQETADAGFDIFLTKPIDIKALQSALKSLLGEGARSEVVEPEAVPFTKEEREKVLQILRATQKIPFFDTAELTDCVARMIQTSDGQDEPFIVQLNTLEEAAFAYDEPTFRGLVEEMITTLESKDMS